jgi:hypothetical protein
MIAKLKSTTNSAQTINDNSDLIAKAKSKKKPGTLYSPGVVNKTIDGFESFRKALPKLKTEKSRIAGLKKVANSSLRAADVAEVNIVSKKLEPGILGGFNPRTWEIEIGSDLVTGNINLVGQRDIEGGRGLSNTIYHELFHAEQFFRMAQMLATPINQGGGGRTAQEIADEMGIPLRIAQAAVGSLKTYSLSPEQLNDAKVYYQCVYGPDTIQNGRYVGESRGNRELIMSDTNKYYAEYRALSLEKDAFTVGDTLQYYYINRLENTNRKQSSIQSDRTDISNINYQKSSNKINNSIELGLQKLAEIKSNQSNSTEDMAVTSPTRKSIQLQA